MSSMGLDGPSVVPSPEDHVRLPQGLIEVAAKLSVSSDSKVRLIIFLACVGSKTMTDFLPRPLENSLKPWRTYQPFRWLWKTRSKKFVTIWTRTKDKKTNTLPLLAKVNYCNLHLFQYGIKNNPFEFFSKENGDLPTSSTKYQRSVISTEMLTEWHPNPTQLFTAP